MSQETGPLTAEDIERGWKEINVEHLHGAQSFVRLTVPGFRKAREIGLAFEKSQDPWTLLKSCLPEDLQHERWLDRLTPKSVGELQTIAVAMLCGNSALKQSLPAEMPVDTAS